MRDRRMKFLIIGLVKGGQVIAVFFLFVAFVSMLLYGKMTWTEPNIAILTFEIIGSTVLLIGSIAEMTLTLWPFLKKGSK